MLLYTTVTVFVQEPLGEPKPTYRYDQDTVYTIPELIVVDPSDWR